MTAEVPVVRGQDTSSHSKIERGAQAVTNGGVLQVRRSEAWRRQRSYMNEGELVSADHVVVRWRIRVVMSSRKVPG